MATLGRGLDALLSRKKDFFSIDSSTQPQRLTLEVPIELIDYNPNQPRMDFDEEKMQSLCDSIRRYGILQPLIVMKTGNRYQLIAGERRLRAARMAGIFTVPAVFRDADANTQVALALIENIQRVNLNAIELALAYKRLHTEFKLTHDSIAERVGCKRPTVTNVLRLLTLPEEIQNAIRDGRINYSVAKVILTLGSQEEQIAFLHTALEKGISTAQGTENFLSASPTAARPNVRKARDTSQFAKEEELRQHFGTKVVIRKSVGRGAITFTFYSDDEYNALCQRLLDA